MPTQQDLLTQAASVIDDAVRQWAGAQGGMQADVMHTITGNDGHLLQGYIRDYNKTVDSNATADVYTRGLTAALVARGVHLAIAAAAAEQARNSQHVQTLIPVGAGKDRQGLAAVIKQTAEGRVDAMIAGGMDEMINEQLNEPPTRIY